MFRFRWFLLTASVGGFWYLDIRTGIITSTTNATTGQLSHRNIHKNTNSGEFGIVSGSGMVEIII